MISSVFMDRMSDSVRQPQGDLAALNLPGRLPGTASVLHGSELLIGHEQAADVRVLDPIAAVVWDQLDGHTPVAELAADLAIALDLPVESTAASLRALLDSLRVEGLLVGGPPARPDGGHRPLVPIPPESCLGKRLGLARAEVRQLRVLSGGEDRSTMMRVVSNVLEEIVELGCVLHSEGVTIEPDDPHAFVETVVHRAPPGRSRRVHQVFGTGGELLHVDHDRERSLEAFNRTVGGLIRANMDADTDRAKAWIWGPSLETASGVVLVHPSMVDAVFIGLRGHLLERGYTLTPSGMLCVNTDGTLAAGPDPTAPRDDRTWPVAGVLMPECTTGGETLRVSMHLAWRWDQVHFDEVARIVGATECVPICHTPSLGELGSILDLFDPVGD